jgi:hypothetical protein
LLEADLAALAQTVGQVHVAGPVAQILGDLETGHEV